MNRGVGLRIVTTRAEKHMLFERASFIISMLIVEE